MRPLLISLLACLLLCGAGTIVLRVSGARAQTGMRGPGMVTPGFTPTTGDAAAPDARPARITPHAGDMAARARRMCRNRYALQAARLAYLEVQLDLTPAQQPLFQRWRMVRLDSARRGAAACTVRPRPGATAPQGPVERMSRLEDRLKQRIAALDAERPALEALYASLTPAQRALLARPHRRPIGRRAMMRRPMLQWGRAARGARPMARPAPSAPPG